MRGLLLLSTVLAASACTTDAPATDTGQLTRINDQLFADCHSTPGYTCGVQVTVSDGRVRALGIYDDGATADPSAVGTLTEPAQLHIAELIARIPLESPDTVHDVGCGGAPLRTTSADVVFDHDGMRHFDIEYAAEGPMADFSQYLSDLVTGIRTCSSSELVFESCATNTL